MKASEFMTPGAIKEIVIEDLENTRVTLEMDEETSQAFEKVIELYKAKEV